MCDLAAARPAISVRVPPVSPHQLGKHPRMQWTVRHGRPVVAEEEPLDAASPGRPYEDRTEAPSSPRTFTVATGVPAREAGGLWERLEGRG